jgi:ATP-dependent Clp protease ATP-binding subunit ClpA
VAPPPEGRYEAADQPAGHIPFTPGAKKCLESTLREAVAQHQSDIGVEHIALGLLVTNRGLVPPILDEAGLSAPELRAAILDRYRPAS